MPFTTREYDTICALVKDQCKARGWLALGAKVDDDGNFCWTVQTRTGWTSSFRPGEVSRRAVYWIMEDMAEDFADLDEQAAKKKPKPKPKKPSGY